MTGPVVVLWQVQTNCSGVYKTIYGRAINKSINPLIVIKLSFRQILCR